MVNPAKNTICLWYDGDAEDAARFYTKTFPDSSVGAVHRADGRIGKSLGVKPRRVFRISIVPKANGVLCRIHHVFLLRDESPRPKGVLLSCSCARNGSRQARTAESLPSRWAEY